MGIEVQDDVFLPENAVNNENKVPQVSIGMPVYNGELFIREALDSLIAQTFTDFELIISDNASTDGTEAICRVYAAKDKRIRYVRQTENRGAAANFQFVLDRSVGHYFMWAAADDLWDPSWIEALLDARSDDDIMTIGQVVQIDVNGEYLCDRVCGSYRRREYHKYITSLQDKAMFIYGLYDLDYLKNKINIMALCRGPASDQIFLLNLIHDGSFREVEGTKMFYRRHVGQASHEEVSNSVSDILRRVFKVRIISNLYNMYKLRPISLGKFYFIFISVEFYLKVFFIGVFNWLIRKLPKE